MIGFHDALEDWAESTPEAGHTAPRIRYWDPFGEQWRDAQDGAAAGGIAAQYADYLVLSAPREPRGGDLAFFMVLG
jgi:hypothetical protein